MSQKDGDVYFNHILIINAKKTIVTAFHTVENPNTRGKMAKKDIIPSEHNTFVTWKSY